MTDIPQPIPWEPDWTVPPGDILAETSQERGITRTELARRMGCPLDVVDRLIDGTEPLTAMLATRIEQALGVPAAFWTAAEAAYRGHPSLTPPATPT